MVAGAFDRTYVRLDTANRSILRKEVREIPTGKKAASDAGKVLADPKATKAGKVLRPATSGRPRTKRSSRAGGRGFPWPPTLAALDDLSSQLPAVSWRSQMSNVTGQRVPTSDRLASSNPQPTSPFRAKLAPVRARIVRSQAVSSGLSASPTAAARPARTPLNRAENWLTKAKNTEHAFEAQIPPETFKTGAFNRSATLPRAETGRLVDSRLARVVAGVAGEDDHPAVGRGGGLLDRPWSASARSRFWMRGSGSLKLWRGPPRSRSGPPLAGRDAVAAGSGSARRFPHRPCGPEL